MNVWRKGSDGRYHPQGSAYTTPVHPHVYWLLQQAIRIIDAAQPGGVASRDKEIVEDLRFTVISLNPRNGREKREKS